jgi:hypothetical protein
MKQCPHGLPLFQICYECSRIPHHEEYERNMKALFYALKQIDDKLLKLLKLLRKNENNTEG